VGPNVFLGFRLVGLFDPDVHRESRLNSPIEVIGIRR